MKPLTHSIQIQLVTIRLQRQQQLSSVALRFTCQALLVYYYTSNQSLGEAAVSARMSSSEELMGEDLQVQSASIDVRLIGEEVP